jgi:GGDEF domain-containing protein
MDPQKNSPLFEEKIKFIRQEGRLLFFSTLLGLAALVSAALLLREAGYLNKLGLWLLAIMGVTLLVQAGIYIPIFQLRRKWAGMGNELQDCETGAMSRAGFEILLEDELRRGGRYHYPVSLGCLALDSHLPQETLREFCQLVKGTSRCADFIAHCQDHEFWILLPHTDGTRAEKFLSRLQQETKEKLNFKFTAGIAAYRAGENSAQFLMRAQSALNYAKGDEGRKIRYVNEAPAPANA